jgi:hypothetical protein
MNDNNLTLCRDCMDKMHRIPMKMHVHASDMISGFEGGMRL